MSVRVERIGLAELWLGDCLTLTAELQGADALIADPPYGIGYEGRRHTCKGRWRPTGKRWGRIEGDDEPFDPTPWLGFAKVIMWGANYYADRLPAVPSWLIWDKRCGTTSDDGADCEMAWTNLGGPARIFHHLWRGICRAGEENVAHSPRLHPAQKPVALMDWCIERCKIKSGALIADPYMGSAPVGVAAVRRGLRYVGVEINPTHFETACRRVEAAQRQGRLDFGDAA